MYSTLFLANLVAVHSLFIQIMDAVQGCMGMEKTRGMAMEMVVVEAVALGFEEWMDALEVAVSSPLYRAVDERRASETLCCEFPAVPFMKVVCFDLIGRQTLVWRDDTMTITVHVKVNYASLRGPIDLGSLPARDSSYFTEISSSKHPFLPKEIY
jgi:hypothetical protein